MTNIVSWWEIIAVSCISGIILNYFINKFEKKKEKKIHKRIRL